MKKISFILLAVLGLLLMNSCDEDLLDVEQTFEFEEEFVVLTNENTFEGSELFDLAAEVDLIDEYGNKIKDVIIEEASFWLKEFNGSDEQKMLGGSLFVSNPDGSSKTLIIEMGEYVLHELVNNPANLNLNTAGVNKLGDLAANPPHRFMLHYDAEVNEAPLDFTIVFKFKAKMVANPLN